MRLGRLWHALAVTATVVGLTGCAGAAAQHSSPTTEQQIRSAVVASYQKMERTGVVEVSDHQDGAIVTYVYDPTFDGVAQAAYLAKDFTRDAQHPTVTTDLLWEKYPFSLYEAKLALSNKHVVFGQDAAGFLYLETPGADGFKATMKLDSHGLITRMMWHNWNSDIHYTLTAQEHQILTDADARVQIAD
jgi:hypothetical protein